MSMNPQSIPEIPPETVRVVRAAFPKGNIYTWLRDTLGTMFLALLKPPLGNTKVDQYQASGEYRGNHRILPNANH